MAKEEKKKQGAPPANVVALPQHCPVDECKKKQRRAGFCEEHFLWFKEGLINRSGERAKDFDKKYQAYSRRQKQAA